MLSLLLHSAGAPWPAGQRGSIFRTSTGGSGGGLTITRAYVVAVEGIVPDEDLAEALRDHVRHTLSPHKYPREVVFLARMPRTGSGKIDRSEIRRLVERAE